MCLPTHSVSVPLGLTRTVLLVRIRFVCVHFWYCLGGSVYSAYVRYVWKECVGGGEGVVLGYELNIEVS